MKYEGLAGGVCSNSFDDEMDIMIMTDKTLSDAIEDSLEYQLGGSVASPLTEGKKITDTDDFDFDEFGDETLDIRFFSDDMQIGGTEYNAATIAAGEYVDAYADITGGMMDDDDIIGMVINSR
ncbi:MAG: hypothetical protein IKA36_04920 [Clostridia bacterium]|nr:hypothetical protein [Clostridia bacterium]